MESCDSLIEALDAYEGAVVIVTHNELLLHALANRLIVFDRNRILIHEGGYQDFLDRVGWESDEAEKEGEKRAEINVTGSSDRKALRKEKALIIQEKSEVLRPLEAEISRLERRIADLEAELSENNLLLVEASTAGDGERISFYAKRNTEIEAELEELYDHLTTVTEEFETNSTLFAERLQNLI
jgi:ATP-binding cassette subfamily F protein 3